MQDELKVAINIWPVKTIDEGIELLTGVKAGVMMEDGTFEEGPVNYLVDMRLKALAEAIKAFARVGETNSHE